MEMKMSPDMRTNRLKQCRREKTMTRMEICIENLAEDRYERRCLESEKEKGGKAREKEKRKRKSHRK